MGGSLRPRLCLQLLCIISHVYLGGWCSSTELTAPGHHDTIDVDSGTGKTVLVVLPIKVLYDGREVVPTLTIREGDDAESLATQFCTKNRLTDQGCAKVTDIAKQAVHVKIKNRPTVGTLPEGDRGASTEQL